MFEFVSLFRRRDPAAGDMSLEFYCSVVDTQQLMVKANAMFLSGNSCVLNHLGNGTVTYPACDQGCHVYMDTSAAMHRSFVENQPPCCSDANRVCPCVV